MRQLLRAAALGFTLSSLLVGCGGGGGSGSNSSSGSSSASMTVSGIAGAPVAGGHVIIEGADGTSQVVRATLDANGKANVNVSTLKPPYLIQVTGNVNGSAVQYVSLANASDVGKTISVSPLTDIAVAKAAGSSTQSLFTSPSNLDAVAANLPAQASQVSDLVINVLSQIDPAENDSSKVDIFHYDPSQSGGFHTKLDALLDVLTIAPQPSSNNITVTYKAEPTVTVTFDETSASAPTKLDAPTNVDAGTVATTLTAIQDQITHLQNMFASSVPAQSDLNNLFDVQNFLDSGLGFTDFYNSVLSQGTGMKISNVSIAKWVSPTQVWIRFTITSPDGTPTDPLGWEVNKVNGTWQFAGNQRIGVDLSIKSEGVTDGLSYASGIRFGVIPKAKTTSGQSISYAIITGPGLPGNGITMVPKPGQTWFAFANTANGDNLMVMDNCSSTVGSLYFCGGDITAVRDNSTYNVQLFDVNNTLLNPGGYDVYLGKAPLTAAGVQSRSASFATFNDPSVYTASVTISWNMPAWMSADSDNIYASGPTNAQGGSNGGSYYKDQLLPNTVSSSWNISSLGLISPVNHINQSVVLLDATGLRFRTNNQWNSI